MWDRLRTFVVMNWPIGKEERQRAARRGTMEQRMIDWGREIEVDGESVNAWRAGRTAPVEVRSFDGRRR